MNGKILTVRDFVRELPQFTVDNSYTQSFVVVVVG